MTRRQASRSRRPRSVPTGSALALLGLVAEEPTHAYRVEEKIRERRMSEWTEIGFSSIYRVLSALERGGLARSRLEHEGQGATRKVLEATPLGRAALAEGVLAELGSLRPVEVPFRVGLAFVTHAPRAPVLERLEERAARVANALREVERLRRDVPAAPPTRARGGRSVTEHRRWITARLVLDHVHSHLVTEHELVVRARRLVSASPADVFSRPR